MCGGGWCWKKKNDGEEMGNGGVREIEKDEVDGKIWKEKEGNGKRGRKRGRGRGRNVYTSQISGRN